MVTISSTQDDQKQYWQIRVTISQILPVLVKNVLLLAYGLSVAYPTILIPNLSNPASNENIYLNEDQISWIGSINMLSSLMACLISGIVSQAIGRKITMQTTSVLMILSWLIFRYCGDVWQIYVALVIFGFAGGLLESPTLTYVAEITEPRLRGSFLSTGPLSVALGTLFEYLLGSIFDWRTVTQYSMIPAIVVFILLFFVPESPYWLITKNRLQEARKSLAMVRGWTTIEKIETEFQEMLDNSSAKLNDTAVNTFKIGDYLERQFILPFILLIYLFFLFAFSGFGTILLFSVKIFEVLKVPINEYDATVILGVAQLSGSVTCVLVIHYIGRRRLAFITITVGAISLIIVATYAHLTNIKYLYSTNKINENADLDYKWIPFVFILSTVFAFSCGVRPLPWNLLAEVFTMKTRAVGTGAIGAIFYAFAFGSHKSFLSIVATITLPGIFWLYALIDFIGLIIIYFFLPEIEGKSLQEITNHFARKTKLDNNVG